MKHTYISILICFFICIDLYSQKEEEYLKEIDSFADIYTGLVESKYSNLDAGHPYYKSINYMDGSIVYNGIRYPNLKLRLDLYKDLLIAKAPHLSFGTVISPENIDSVYINSDLFIWHQPTKKEEPKAGYYRIVYQGNSLQLLCREYYLYSKSRITDPYQKETHYYVFYKGHYYSVKNKNSFNNILPDYKDEIDQYVKRHGLDFGKNKEPNLRRLAEYCENLLSQEDKTIHLPSSFIDPVFENTDIQSNYTRIPAYDHTIHVPENLDIITDFPYSNLLGESTPNGSSQYEEKTQIAISENKTYEIGNPYSTGIETAKLTGKIVDFKTQEPLIGIKIVSTNSRIAAVTNVDGNYSIEIPVGRDQLDLSGINIKDSRRFIHLYGDGTLDIELSEEGVELDEVTVFAGRINQVKNIEMGVEKIELKAIKNIPTALGEVDILRAIQTLPGVKTVGEASSGFNVRGGASDQNLILLNDNTLYNPNHLFGFFTAFNSDMVNEAEIYKSSIPARYGGRISSVLDISIKEANKEEFKGKAGIGLVTSNATLEIPLKKNRSSLLLTGRTTYSDWILKSLPDSKSGYNNGTAGFYDFGMALSQELNERDQLNIYAYYSKDRFSFSEEQKYSYQNLNASIKWRKVFNENLFAKFSAGYDHYSYTNSQLDPEFSAYKLSFGINQFFGKADFTYSLDKHKLELGIKSTFYDLNGGEYEPYNSNSQVKPDKLQTERALESAVYIGDQWTISDKLSVDYGIRYSMFNALGPREYYTYDSDLLPYESTVQDTLYAKSGNIFQTYHGPEFRLSSRLLLSDNVSIKAGWNSMRQYIHKLSNSIIMSPTDTWKLSDTNIKPQRGWQGATGVYYNDSDLNWESSIEVYYKQMYDYLDYRSAAQLIMNHHIETDVVNTKGKAYGVEFAVKKKMGKLTGWASYTYSRTLLRQETEKNPNPINKGKWYSADHDKPHDFKFVGNYRFTERYSLSVNIDYSTGRPTTVPAGRYYDNTLHRYQVYYTDRNTYRIPDYFRTDISFNIEPHHRLTLLTHSTLSFGVYNVTGRKNAYNIYYVADKNGVQGYKISIFGAPIPFITYNIKF